MPQRFFRGDAPTQAQVWRLKPPLIAGVITLRIGNKSLEFAAWDAAAIASAWNASKWPEFRGVVASVSGEDVLFTARVAGVPFFVAITVGSTAQGQGAGRNAVQQIALVNSPDGGTWQIGFLGAWTEVAWNIAPADLQTALVGLSTLEAGDVTVSGAAGHWFVTFGGRFAGQPAPSLAVDGADLAGGDAVAVITTIQDGGTGAGGSVDEEPILHAVIASPSIENGIGFFDNGDGSFVRIGKPSSGVLFCHSLLQFQLHVDQGEELTAAQLALVLKDNVGATVNARCYVELADDPEFPIHGTDSQWRPLSTEYVAVTAAAGMTAGQTLTITGLAPLLQQIVDRPGWASGQRVHLHLRTQPSSANVLVDFYSGGGYGVAPLLSVDLTGSRREIQSVALAGSPHGGQVTLTLDDQTADPLPHDAAAAAAQAALEALSNVGAGLVTCSGGPWPAPIVFSFDASLGDLPPLTATDTLANGDVSISTTQQGGPDVEVVVEQRSRGPHHADDPLNWEDEHGAFAVPEAGSQVFCRDGKVDLLYGLKWRSTFTADPATDRLLFAEPQLALWEDQAVELVNDGGSLPAELTAETTYYVRDLAFPFCRLATTPGGPPVNITSTGSGTHTLGVRLTLLETDSRYTGKLGLPRTNKDGYPEYRPRFLEAWIDVARIGVGNGGGSNRVHLDTGNRPVVYQQHKASGGTDSAPAGQLLCAGPGNRLELLAGELGIAIDPEQVAQFDQLLIRAGSVLLGRNVVAGAIERTGGTLQSLGATVDGTLLL